MKILEKKKINVNTKILNLLSVQVQCSPEKSVKMQLIYYSRSKVTICKTKEDRKAKNTKIIKNKERKKERQKISDLPLPVTTKLYETHNIK